MHWVALGGFEADSLKQIVDDVAEFAVEGVELRKTLRLQFGVWEKGLQETGRQRGVDSVEQFHEQQADAITSGEETIRAGVRSFSTRPLALSLKRS
jgi:sugar phosphate isomerase/epimerase